MTDPPSAVVALEIFPGFVQLAGASTTGADLVDLNLQRLHNFQGATDLPRIFERTSLPVSVNLCAGHLDPPGKAGEG